MSALRFTANSRAEKKSLNYDGHQRHAGKTDKALKWRRARRRFARWMRDRIEEAA
jgi:hypothetical protein